MPDDASVSDVPTRAMVEASRPYHSLVGPHGRPLHPLLARLAVGSWVLSVPFDVIALRADTAWVYARFAYLLIGAGLVVGAIASLAGLFDLFMVRRATPAFATGVRHMLAMLASLTLFGFSFRLRVDSGFAWHDAAPASALVLSIAALVCLAAGVVYGSRLVFGHGVRVAEHPLGDVAALETSEESAAGSTSSGLDRTGADA